MHLFSVAEICTLAALPAVNGDSLAYTASFGTFAPQQDASVPLLA